MKPKLLRILRIGKKIALIMGILLAVTILTGTVLFFVYRDRIQNLVIHELNKQLAIPVTAGEISISLLSTFPSIAIDIKDVSTKGQGSSTGEQNLLKAGSVSLRFNLFDILNGRYILQKVKISNAVVHIRTYSDGLDNYHIWKEGAHSDTTAFSVNLEEVLLQTVDITWQDDRTVELYSFEALESTLRGQFSEDFYTLGLTGKWVIFNVQSHETVFAKEREAGLDLLLEVNNKEGSYFLKRGSVAVGEMTFGIEGRLIAKNGREIDLRITTGEASLKTYLDLLPPNFSSRLDQFEMDGKLSLSLVIKGKLGKAGPPSIEAGFILNGGTFDERKTSVSLRQISLTGSYSRPSHTNHEVTDELVLNGFSARLGDSRVSGSMKLLDTGHPSLVVQVNVDALLGDLIPFFRSDTITDANGTIRLDLEFRGGINDPDSLSVSDLVKGNTKGELVLDGIGLAIKGRNLHYKEFNGHIGINDNDLLIESLSGKVGKSDLALQGVFRNFLPWLLLREGVLRVDAALQSREIVLDEILTSNTRSSSGDAYHFDLPDGISLYLGVGIGFLGFREFRASDIHTSLVMRDEEISFNDLTFNSMDGKITADGSIKENRDKQFKVRCNARFSHVNINRMFRDLENFGQHSLVDKNILGFMDADLYYTSDLGQDLAIDLNSIYSVGQISVKSGELIEYAPLYELARYLDIDDLQHIRFSELRNLIEIRNQTIIIPEMEISSSSLNLTLYGTHTFDNQVEYHINLLLSEILARKGKKDRQDEFGPLIDDGLGKTQLFILITGTAEDPKFTYDKASLKTKLTNDLHKEKEEIKEALKEEFNLGKKKGPEQEKRPGQKKEQEKFIIEWEEDEADSLNTPQPRIK
jgi:hypothetical protein